MNRRFEVILKLWFCSAQVDAGSHAESESRPIPIRQTPIGHGPWRSARRRLKAWSSVLSRGNGLTSN